MNAPFTPSSLTPHSLAPTDAALRAEAQASLDQARASAAEAVTAVAKDTTKEILGAFGVKADARSVTAAVNARLKGGAA